MFQKLEDVEKRFEWINQKLQEPGITNDQENYKNLMKELSELEKIVSVYREHKKAQSQKKANQELLETEKEAELKQLAKEELAELDQKLERLEDELKVLLLPKDPNDEKDVIVEIRAGAGGDEACLFADELFRAYQLYAGTRGWKVRTVSYTEGNAGGAKEIIASIAGERVFSTLKYESGVHRVQRVPKTESQGRVHTSTVTVAVIPEAEEVDVEINPNDLRIDVYRSSGHGGQSVNTTDSAVRITHLPTNTVVSCQDGKSQHSNKEQALKVLYSRLKAMEEERAEKEASDQRLAQIGTGDRSERVRTYNFPQSRITDHRINLTIHKLGEVMNGSLNQLIEPLMAHYQAEALKKQNTQ